MRQINKTPKSGSRFALRLACLTLVLSTLSGVAYAASAQDVTVTLSPATKIVLDGAEQTFYNVSGKEVHPISYNGTIYLPVRSISELIGKNTDWNETTLTVTLSGVRTTPRVTGTPEANAVKTAVSAQLRPDFTIVVDGAVRSFTDASGARVYPLLYSGTTYLPVRASGELMGKSVSWSGATDTVTLSAPADGTTLVTDADTISSATQQKPGQPTGGSNSYIGEAKAKSIALSHAGFTASQVTFARAYLERDDGRWEYDVEFYTDNKEYDYEIDAASGAIISFDYDAEYYSRPASGTSSTDSATYIGKEKAKEIALSRAGLAASAISAYKCELDRDDGVMKYEIEFRSGGYEYEVDVNATTGAVIKYDLDWDD